jgi:hypothetical protein
MFPNEKKYNNTRKMQKLRIHDTCMQLMYLFMNKTPLGSGLYTRNLSLRSYHTYFLHDILLNGYFCQEKG